MERAKRFSVPKRSVAAMMCAVIMTLFSIVINNHIFSMSVAVAFWAYGMRYSIRNIKQRFALFSFNIGFFAFILGGFTISYLKNGDFSFFAREFYTSTREANIHTCLCVAICMICVNCCYLAFWKGSFDGQDDTESDNSKMRIVPSKYVRLLLVIILIASYICRLAQAIEDYVLVKSVSYYESVRYLSTLPSFVTHIGSLYFVTLFMYLTTYPSKKKTIVCFFSLAVVELLILAAGGRGEPVSILLLVIFYTFLRTRAGYNDFVITKKMVIVGLIVVPIVMYGLQALSYTRNNETYDKGFIEGVTDFVETQGGSATIIANSYDLDEKIYNMTHTRTFILGELRFYFKTNVFTRVFTGQQVSLRTVDDALSGDNFLRSYGYAYAPVTYSRYVGAGSTYIAETYYDGGYILLALVNVFIAFILAKIDNVSVSNFISCSILMNIFRYMPLLPRGMMLDWLTNTFAFQNIIYFVIIYYMCRRTKASDEEIKNEYLLD